MKKFEFVNEEEASVFYIGTAPEIKTLYKSLVRAWKKWQTDLFPLFEDFPQFNPFRLYGLKIVEESEFEPVGSFHIVGEGVLARILLEMVQEA